MKHLINTETKGHGYLRKTKIGLMSGIALSSALFVGGLISSDVAFAGDTNEVSSATDKSEYESLKKVIVKASELESKVNELKEKGVTVNKTEEESVGRASDSKEVEILKNKAEAKVQDQLAEMDKLKIEADEVKVEKDKLKEVKDKWLSPNLSRKSVTYGQLNRITFDEDLEKIQELTNFKSNKGEVMFYQGGRANLSNTNGVSDVSRGEFSNKVTKSLVKIPIHSQTSNNYKAVRSGYNDAYIVKVSNGEKISYNINYTEDTVFYKNLGIKTLEIEKTYTSNFGNDVLLFDYINSKYGEYNVIFSNVDVDRNKFLNVFTKFTFKNSNGEVIPINELFSKMLNYNLFGDKKVFNSDDLTLDDFKKVESRPDMSYSINSDGSLNLLTKFTNLARESGNYLSSRISILNRISKSNVDVDKANKVLSANYHDVYYTEVSTKGVVVQRFVNEDGVEIKYSVKSEAVVTGEAVNIEKPEEIVFDNKRYVFKSQDKETPKVAGVGEEIITYTYKLKYSNNKEPKVVTEVIPIETKYVGDDNLEYGKSVTDKEGKEGKIVTTITYTTNLNDGSVKENEPVVVKTSMEEKVVKVGTKSKIVTKVLEPEVEYVKDSDKDKGRDNEVIPGDKGSETTITTYKVDPKTGKVTETVGEPVVVKAGKTIIKVGGRDKVVTKVLEPEVEYVKDPTRDKGTRDEVIPGDKGSETTTTTYNVDSKTGVVTETVGEPVVVKPGKTIIKVGGRDKVVTKVLEPEVEYVKDPDKDKGSDNEVIPGDKGSETTITTYNVDPKTGVVTETVDEPVVVKPGKTIIKVGSRDKIKPEIIPDGASLYSKPKLFSAVPNEAPVLDVPEFTGGVVPNESPVLEVPEFTGGVTPSDAPVLDVSEFASGVTPSDAPVLDVPEFTGGVTPDESPVLEVPAYAGGVTPDEAPVLDVPEFTSSTAFNHSSVLESNQKSLPDTGSSFSNVHGLLALASASLLAASKRKKER